MGVAWIIKYVLISIPVIAAYNGSCTDRKTMETRECDHFKISKLKFNEYPVNSTSLQHLYINNAGLKEIDYNVFHSMHRLQVIDLTANTIEFLDHRLFINLSDLHVLYLSINKLQRLSDGRLFQAQRNLIKLDLSVNRLVFLNSSVLEPLRALKNLNMSFNPFNCNCELWKTIFWCKNKSLETYAFCETPNKSTWSSLSSKESKNKCPFSLPKTDLKEVLLIMCIIFIAIFCIVCITLTLVFFYCRNERKKESKIIKVHSNQNFVRRPGEENLHCEEMIYIRKSYLSVIPEGTECSSRAASSCQLNMETGSVFFEELNESQSEIFETENKSKHVNFPPQSDTMNMKSKPKSVSCEQKNSHPSEEAHKTYLSALVSFQKNSDITFPNRVLIENDLYLKTQRAKYVIPLATDGDQNYQITSNLSLDYPLYSEPNIGKNMSTEINTDEQNIILPSTLTVENPLYSEPEIGIMISDETPIIQQNISLHSSISVENPLYSGLENPVYSEPEVGKIISSETATVHQDIDLPCGPSTKKHLYSDLENPVYSDLEVVKIVSSETATVQQDVDLPCRPSTKNPLYPDLENPVYSEPDVGKIISSETATVQPDVDLPCIPSTKNPLYSDLENPVYSEPDVGKIVSSETATVQQDTDIPCRPSTKNPLNSEVDRVNVQNPGKDDHSSSKVPVENHIYSELEIIKK